MNLLQLAGLGRNVSFATTISAAHHVQNPNGPGSRTDRPEFSWPDYHTDPIGEISQDFPIDPFNQEGDGLADADGDGDVDDEDEAMFELLGEFSADEVEWLDQAVQLKGMSTAAEWQGVADWVNAAALAKRQPRRRNSAAALALEDRQQQTPTASPTASPRKSQHRLVNTDSVAVTVSPTGKKERQGAAASKLNDVVGRRPEECRAEWERRIDRYTAGGAWVGHGLDRRALTGRNTEEEATIARKEMLNRLKSLECSHMTTMRVMDANKCYPRTQGAWFCDECGLPNPPGRLFHCHACEDYDLCSACMRAAKDKKKGGKGGGPNKWASFQADTSLVNQVLDSGELTGATHGGRDLFTGKQSSTVMNDYHNPYIGTEIIHGILRYPGSTRAVPGSDLH